MTPTRSMRWVEADKGEKIMLREHMKMVIPRIQIFPNYPDGNRMLIQRFFEPNPVKRV